MYYIIRYNTKTAFGCLFFLMIDAVGVFFNIFYANKVTEKKEFIQVTTFPDTCVLNLLFIFCSA